MWWSESGSTQGCHASSATSASSQRPTPGPAWALSDLQLTDKPASGLSDKEVRHVARRAECGRAHQAFAFMRHAMACLLRSSSAS